MSIELMTRLKALKLYGMAQCWPELVAKARHSEFDPEHLMSELLAAETAEREVRSIAYQMTAARFPAHRDLAGFDFSQSRVDETLIRRLHCRRAFKTDQLCALNFDQGLKPPVIGMAVDKCSAFSGSVTSLRLG